MPFPLAALGPVVSAAVPALAKGAGAGALGALGAFGKSAIGALGGAAGSIGEGLLGFLGNKEASEADPRFTNVPPPAYVEALNRYIARALALNMTQQPGSFADFRKSGGESPMDVINPGLSPLQLRQLGIVGQDGQPVPFSYFGEGDEVGDMGPAEEGLSDKEKLYIGYQMSKMGKEDDPLAVAYRKTKQISRAGRRFEDIEGKLGGDLSSRKRTRLGKRQDKIEKRITDLRKSTDKLLKDPNNVIESSGY